MAYSLVIKYGMSKKVGQLSFREAGSGEMSIGKPYSEDTAEIVDLEVREIIRSAYERARTILSEKKDQLLELGKTLLEKEIMKSEEIEKILGPRPYVQPHAGEHQPSPPSPSSTSPPPPSASSPPPSPPPNFSNLMSSLKNLQ
eukprot:TRINITY_DN559_c0_g5_i1.p1 TRINITY_DN559_c0_g5~~TRINITY_DN559_c0_g5_i1.p1  ORF type:complete len:143 (+),score=50.29 TRINITY_DN559_c0_g5_i1:79-507(+)